MAYTAPTTWAAGQTVTAANLNEQIRDNFFHVAGSVGFTAGMSTSVGIQPAAGYFAGANLRNYHIEAGKGTGSTAGTIYSFANAFEAAPVVTMTVGTSVGSDTRFATIIAVSSSGFTGMISVVTSGTTGYWIAWGSDT
jgi:hypothetical protein